MGENEGDIDLDLMLQKTLGILTKNLLAGTFFFRSQIKQTDSLVANIRFLLTLFKRDDPRNIPSTS